MSAIRTVLSSCGWMQRTADQVGQDAAEHRDCQADKGVRETALGRLDSANTSARGHVLVPGQHDEESADHQRDGRTQCYQLVEQVDDRTRVHTLPPCGRVPARLRLPLMAVQRSLRGTRLEGVPKPCR